MRCYYPSKGRQYIEILRLLKEASFMVKNEKDIKLLENMDQYQKSMFKDKEWV